MFRKFFVSLALIASTSVYAGQTNIDTTGLTDAQIAELKAHAAQVVAATAKGPEASTKEAGAMITLAATWGPQMAAAAEGFAKALGIAARELGITVNDFLKTDAGKLTAVLIIWKVAGASFLKLCVGILFMIIGSIISRIIYKRLFTREYREVQYSRLFGLSTGTTLVRVPKSISELRTDGEWLAFWMMIIFLFMSFVIGGVIIT